jgi:hypothetical protein
VRPSALAVFTLITNSNLVDCTTGRSAGLAFLRMCTGIDADLTISPAHCAIKCGAFAQACAVSLVLPRVSQPAAKFVRRGRCSQQIITIHQPADAVDAARLTPRARIRCSRSG